MKKLNLIIVLLSLSMASVATEVEPEKPVQHLKLPAVTTLNEAEQVFLKKTEELKSFEVFDASSLQEIHVITYSLEKSLAYYVKHLTGKNKSLAEAMAAEVERVHLNSENNRAKETQSHLNNYFRMAQYLPLTR